MVVDLAPITDPDLVPVAVIRALGLPDQQGRSTMELLLRFVGDRRILLVLDNCEHLLDACAALIVALQGGCPEVTVTAAEICGRLDGVPLAIELAAARVRVLSLAEIRDSLHDRFRLLTGVHARRCAASIRCGPRWIGRTRYSPSPNGWCSPRFQVLDLLTLLVEKSLVVAESSSGRAIPAVEQVRQNEAGKTGQSGRPTPCVPVTAITTGLWRRCSTPRLRTAMSSFSSRPKPRSTTCVLRSRGAAKTPIPDLRRSWRRRCSHCGPYGAASGKGWTWFDAVLTDQNGDLSEVAPAVRARALADKGHAQRIYGCQRQHAAGPAGPGDRAGSRRPRPIALGTDRLRRHRSLRPRGGPAVLRRGDRPGPLDRRRMEARPDFELAGVRVGHGG